MEGILLKRVWMASLFGVFRHGIIAKSALWFDFVEAQTSILPNFPHQEPCRMRCIAFRVKQSFHEYIEVFMWKWQIISVQNHLQVTPNISLRFVNWLRFISCYNVGSVLLELENYASCFSWCPQFRVRLDSWLNFHWRLKWVRKSERSNWMYERYDIVSCIHSASWL